jgi:hypothetical protein
MLQEQFELLYNISKMIRNNVKPYDVYNYLKAKIELIPVMKDDEYQRVIKMLDVDNTLREHAYDFTMVEWENPNIIKWCLCFTHRDNEVCVDYVLSKCYANNYYYKTREDVVGLIQKIGDENLRVYFNTKRKYAVKGRVKGRI